MAYIKSHEQLVQENETLIERNNELTKVMQETLDFLLSTNNVLNVSKQGGVIVKLRATLDGQSK